MSDCKHKYILLEQVEDYDYTNDKPLTIYTFFCEKCTDIEKRSIED